MFDRPVTLRVAAWWSAALVLGGAAVMLVAERSSTAVTGAALATGIAIVTVLATVPAPWVSAVGALAGVAGAVALRIVFAGTPPNDSSALVEPELARDLLGLAVLPCVTICVLSLYLTGRTAWRAWRGLPDPTDDARYATGAPQQREEDQ